MVPSPRPSRISAIRSTCSSSVMSLTKPVISPATGSSPLSSSTSIILSSAPFDPESGSVAPSLTSYSRVFSIKNPTFSTEMASSGIGTLPQAFRAPLTRRPARLIHCGAERKPASFRPGNQDATKDDEETPDALECGQGPDHEDRGTGDGREHPVYPAARRQRRNPQTALARSRFRHRGRPAQDVDPLAGGGDAPAAHCGRYQAWLRQ